MKFITATVLVLSLSISYGQNYPFAKEFVAGGVILNDSSQKRGQIEWFPSQHEKLKYRESENSKTNKYIPEEIAGFWADTFKFVSLLNFQACASSYALAGKPIKIKHSFGQV